MKLELVFGSLFFLVAGIMLAGNSSGVMGQTEQGLRNTNSNTTEGAWAVSNKTTFDTSWDADRKLLGMPTGLQKYENARYGINFTHPHEWGEALDICSNGPSLFSRCGPIFVFEDTKLQSDTKPSSNISIASLAAKNATEAKPDIAEAIREEANRVSQESKTDYDFLSVGVNIINLNESAGNDNPCNCNTLKDFVAWDYNSRFKKENTFLNDNLTSVGKNYSAWQTEILRDNTDKIDFDDLNLDDLDHTTDKSLDVYVVNGNVGYIFSIIAPPERLHLYLDDFKNMLKSVELSPPTPEKKPSFLTSSQIMNLSSLPSTPATQGEPIKISSSNDFIDSIGYLHVVGEVENNTPANIAFVKVSGTFYDSSNQVVGTEFTYTDPSDIGPGGKAPFDLTLLSASIPVSEIDHYNLVASYQ